MERLKEIRKELCVSQKKVAEHLNISRECYAKIEERGCKEDMKKRIIFFFILECYSTNISKVKICKYLNIKRTNLQHYKKPYDWVFEKEREQRMLLKNELNEMLK